MNQRNVFLILVLILIIAAVFYFESEKIHVKESSIDSRIGILAFNANDSERIEAKTEKYARANELVGPEGYINVENITITENIGKKVILVDFWTYSCINCQRTLPYLTSWDLKYRDDGLLIIGVHTPEFAFEKEYDNVLKAVKKYNIEYPVVQDNDKETWRAYQNRYWPRKYIIDIDGFIVYDHIGEGAYKETEEKIQELLEERNKVLKLNEEIDSSIVDVKSVTKTKDKTPEIYFGYYFSRDQLGNVEGIVENEVVDYSLPDSKEKNMFYLDGSWKNNKDEMELISDEGSIYLEFFAREVNFVAGSNGDSNLEVFLDGEKIKDVTVNDNDLYNLISLEESINGVLELRADKGLMAYTFTFG